MTYMEEILDRMRNIKSGWISLGKDECRMITAALAAMPIPSVRMTSDGNVAAVVALAEAGIPVDVQELLLHGDQMRGIAPGALAKAMAASSITPAADLQAENERLRAALGKALDTLDLYADPRAYVDEDGDLPGGHDHYEGVAAKLAAEEIRAALERT